MNFAKVLKSRFELDDKKKIIVMCAAVFLVILIDQLTKYLVAINFQLNQSIPVIMNILDFTYIHNFGAGFGIFQNQLPFLIIFSLLTIGIILFYYKKINTTYLQLFISVFLGAAVSNLIDRIRLGYIVDFIDFKIWPVFNFADSMLTISSICLICYLIFKKEAH